MRSVPNLLLCVGAIALGAMAGCSNAPSEKELRVMGHPEVVYLQSPANLTVWEMPGYSPADGMQCFPAGGVLGALLCGEIARDIDWSRRKAIAAREGALAVHADDVEKLGFNDEAYAAFISIIKGVTWLPDKEVDRIPWSDDEVQYVAVNKADSIVYMQPVFALSPDGTEFSIYVVAGIQKFAPDHPRDVYDFRRREFSFSHELTLVEPGMNWTQQKAAERRLRFMDADQATQAWLDNDGARLHAAFAQDLPQIEAGIKQLFGN